MTALELVDIIAPDHDRTSCSDADRSNGFGTGSSGGFRCARCALLELAMDEKELPPGLQLSVMASSRE